jgi:hypothetical protein
MSLTLALMCCLVFTASPAAQPKSKAKPKRVPLAGLVVADPLPPGYKVTKNEVRDGEKLRGHLLAVEKEGVVSKAVINIDERPITTRPAMVAAAKGYVNGTAQAFAGAGLKLVRNTIPDLAKADLKKRFVADLVYEKPDGGEVFVQLQIFFGKAGYNVQVVGDNKKDFDAMAAWGRSVAEP